jgi:hypothetical protein
VLFEIFPIARIQPNFGKNSPDFLTLFKVGSQKYKGHLFNLLSYLGCSQIWQNLPANHGHFGYNSKLTPKKKTWITASCYCENASSSFGSFKILALLKVRSHLVLGTLVLLSPLTHYASHLGLKTYLP